MKKNMFSSILLVFAIIIIVSIGTTFAYFLASAENKDVVGGETLSFDVKLTLKEEYKATSMVPLKDNLVSTAIKYNSVCRDKDGYQVCSLYKLTLSNAGTSYELNGYLMTNNSTYETDNLKYQIYDSSYTAVSDIMNVSRTKDEKVYFAYNNNRINTNMKNDNIVYYLVMWISDTGSLQSEDYSKSYSGIVGFETLGGERIEANF